MQLIADRFAIDDRGNAVDLATGERVSIVDGNVRRVLGRLLAFEGDLSLSGPQRGLWALAQDLLPPSPSPEDMVSYTQGLMDLGAGLCTRTRPSKGNPCARARSLLVRRSITSLSIRSSSSHSIEVWGRSSRLSERSSTPSRSVRPPVVVMPPKSRMLTRPSRSTQFG